MTETPLSEKVSNSVVTISMPIDSTPHLPTEEEEVLRVVLRKLKEFALLES